MSSSAQIGIHAEITASIESFKFEEHNLRELLTGRDGPVVKDLVRRAIRVEAAAKRNATGRPGPNVQTGRLRGSITWRVGADAESPFVDVGTAVEYAPYVEDKYPYLAPALESARTT